MNKKKIIIGILIVVVIAGFFVIKSMGKKKSEGGFTFEEIRRGNIENKVSCTGTLNAVSQADVGSQVSGIVDKLLVDFNQNVKKGQLLLVLDKTLFQASVRDAEAGVLRAKAQYEQAQAELKRNKPLYEKGHLSESEFLVTKTTAETTHAALISAESTLKRARTQLEYTEIRSPIDGTVIERTVEIGQTIAASFQAPKLFIIAEDLTKMQIEALVDESDIGQIKEGLPVNFTVQSYPDKTFIGNVRQIRLNPTTVQDVVNYTVVIDASNEEKLLLPGMTATVDFTVEEKKDILLVPNSALSFVPSQEQMTKLMEKMKKRFEERRNNMNGGGGGMREQGPGMGGGMMSGGFGKMPENMGKVYFIDEKGELAMAFFEKGVSDNRNTEIKRSRMLTEGMKVITGILDPNDAQAKNQGPGMFPFGGRPGGGMGGGRRR